MKNSDLIRQFKQEMAPFLGFKGPSKASKKEGKSKKPTSGGKLVDIDAKDSADQLRSLVFVIVFVVGTAVLLIHFFGQTWLDHLLNQADQSHIGIAVAAGISLIAVSILSGILKMIFGLLKLTPAFKDMATKRSFKPVFRAAYTFLMFYLLIVVFLKLMTFMAQQDIFSQIDHYAEQGFEFNIDTDEGPKTIEFKEGKLNILAR